MIGGAILALLDREGISNASSLDPNLETLDGYTRQIVSAELFINATAGRLVRKIFFKKFNFFVVAL